MRQALNVTYAATVEWLDEDDRTQFDRELLKEPTGDPHVDRSRNVEGIFAAMGGPPPPPSALAGAPR